MTSCAEHTGTRLNAEAIKRNAANFIGMSPLDSSNVHAKCGSSETAFPLWRRVPGFERRPTGFETLGLGEKASRSLRQDEPRADQTRSQA